MDISPGPLLKAINNPSDLKKLERSQLHEVCDELRQYIVDVVSIYGGHFGASLGVVELTVALHYVFNTPTTSWFGMLVTRHMDIKFLPVAEIIFQPTENIKD